MSNKKTNSHKNKFVETLHSKFLPSEERVENVPLSLILPVYNCSEVIGMTLESIQDQAYPALEIIVVDAGSTDRTLEIINSYASMISRTYTVASYNMADMINRGISFASGRYASVLLPGTYYISKWTYKTFAEKIVDYGFPDLIYCGSIQREIKRDPRLILLPFDVRLLEKGRHPASVPACWFRCDLFEKVGKLNARYTARTGLDFFCRVAREEKVRTVMIDRVFIDFDYGRFSYGKVLKFAADTWLIIWEQFGFWKAVSWFLTLNHFALLKSVYRHLKHKFT